MPPTIRDPGLLELLGDILHPDWDPVMAGPLRLRLMHRGFSWQSLVNLADEQDVLLPLIFALSVHGLLLPLPRTTEGGHKSHVTARLTEIYRQHLERRNLEQSQIKRIISTLNGISIAPLLIKGARYLVAPVGSWCEARSMADFDILVRPGDAERAYDILTAAGYQSGPGFMPDYHHLPVLECEGEPAALEIHTDALAVVAQKILPTEHVWAHAEKAAGGSFFVMPVRWHALFGLLHHQISDHGHVRRILAIKGLWEWTMLAREFSTEDWTSIVAHMESAGAIDVLGNWLVQAHRLFAAELPGRVPISPDARQIAEATIRFASDAYWKRRTFFIADQLRHSFSKETLGLRYGISPSQVSVMDVGRYALHLLAQHRGQVFRRLTGYRDRPS